MIEAEAAAAGPSLDALTALCDRRDVTRAQLERHLAKCPPSDAPRARIRSQRVSRGALTDALGTRTHSPRMGNGELTDALSMGSHSQRVSEGALTDALSTGSHSQRVHQRAPTNAPSMRTRSRRVPEDAPPDSGRRPAPRELAAPDEELRRRARLLTGELERMITEGAEARHIASVAGSLAKVDSLILARERSLRPIEEHADFEGLLTDLVASVAEELGAAAVGAEGRIAARFEERQARRAAAGAAERRAA